MQRELVGITTTLPVEVIYASGRVACDLNNLFVTADYPSDYSDLAVLEGYPRNVCQWIKGIYGVAKSRTDIKTIVGVTQGDCSNTHALMETLELAGKKIIPFAYPYDRRPEGLRFAIDKFAHTFGVTNAKVEEARDYLNSIRRLAWRIDELTWRENKVTGFENHLFLVSTSDFESNPEAFRHKLEKFIKEVEEREPLDGDLRLAYLGVPPIFPGIYDYLESLGARVVYNETQYEFSLPDVGENIVEQYLNYSYPYSIFYRISKIKRELKRRRIQGIIHYVQSFCFRQIEDLIIRQKLAHYPFLTIEGGESVSLDERTKLRLQAFIEILAGRR